MKIGIIGSAPVGQALAAGFSEEGHDVKLGTRKPADRKITQWQEQAGTKISGTFADAARFGELAVLATKREGGATENAIKRATPNNWPGRS